ncbi:acetyl-CoA carboxylase biotin carboxyl carrier protein [Bacillus sp. FSL W8-0102]|uniref:acetyl-CoA carboxylase biotin carboxyl carrier protein n=1 Tax=Bacillus sp. FSL W8-0102 TaxID=2978205 RepID=UPI0030F7F995
MKVQEIRELIKLVDQSSIDEFVYEEDGAKIQMKKRAGVTYVQQEPVSVQPAASLQPVAGQVAAPKEQVALEKASTETAQEKTETSNTDSALHKITSPMVGTFYQSPSPDADPYVKVGSKVQKNTVVCIIEAMKLFNEIEAEVDGEIVEVLVKDGQLVEYGQPLFLVKTE